MPANWMYVGIIRLCLPNARIVDVRRHPLACCFANWKQLYGRGLEHTYSMENMGRYYADYVRLLRLVDKVQPGTHPPRRSTSGWSTMSKAKSGACSTISACRSTRPA